MVSGKPVTPLYLKSSMGTESPMVERQNNKKKRLMD